MGIKTVLIILGLLIAGASSCIAAPSTNDVATQEILRNKIERQQELKRQQEEEQKRLQEPQVNLQKSKADIESLQFPEEKIMFPVNKIVITGEQARKFAWLEKDLQKYAQRKLGVQGINILAKYAQDKIMGRGFVTSKIVVPEQDLSTGRLELQLIAGKISKIRFDQEQQAGTWRNAFPTKAGKILNVRDLEQGLEQMKRVPNQDVKMQLVPAAKLGDTEVVIQVTRSKPWSIAVSLDDAGLEHMGRMQATSSFNLYNPSGLNDVLSYSLNDYYFKEQIPTASNKGYSLYYSIPYGNYSLSINKYQNRYHQRVNNLTPFISSGKSDTLEIELKRLLYRDQVRKYQGFVKIIQKDRHSYINDTEIGVQRQETTAYQLGLQHRQYIGESTLDTIIYYQKGVPWFGAAPGLTDTEAGKLTTRYSLWSASLNLAKPLKVGKVKGRYNLNIKGQYTKDALYSSEQISIGGRYSVRGFDGEQSLLAENGIIIRNEISIPLANSSLEPYIGLDCGRVWGAASEYLLGNSLMGTVVGLRGAVGKNISYDAFIGAPLHKPKGFKTAKTALGFQITCQI